MDFRFKHKDGKTWDTEGLGRFLKMQYPGAKTLSEALKKELEARAQRETKTSHNPSSIELEPALASQDDSDERF